MSNISGATGASRRELQPSTDAPGGPGPTPGPREIDPDALGTAHAAADLATVARNMKARAERVVSHEVQTVGRGKMSSSASSSREYASEPEARTAFAAQAKKLLDVNQWTALSGKENATFELYDRTGAPAAGRPAGVGDFVRIVLPGQSKPDWVRIEDVALTSDRAGVRVRPSYDPTKHPLTPDVTAHFFSRETTNAFLLERDGKTVTARVEGRDESANVGPGAGGLERAVRNRAVCEGAWGIRRQVPGTRVEVDGMQQHQWNRFTDNLVSSP